MTKEEVHQLFEYRDGGLIAKVSKGRTRAGCRAGTVDSMGYRRIQVNKVLYREHQLIFLMFHGRIPAMVDHINQVRSDNRIENLREVTRSENGANQPTHYNNASGFKGVSKIGNRWRAQIAKDGKGVHLGSFGSPEDAAKAYNKAAIELYGQFAFINKETGE